MADNNNHSPREISLERVEVLKKKIEPYLENIAAIRTGLTETDEIRSRQKQIMEIMGAGSEQWNDWHWQISNRITSAEELKKYIPLSKRQIMEIKKSEKIPLGHLPVFPVVDRKQQATG